MRKAEIKSTIRVLVNLLNLAVSKLIHLNIRPLVFSKAYNKTKQTKPLKSCCVENFGKKSVIFSCLIENEKVTVEHVLPGGTNIYQVYFLHFPGIDNSEAIPYRVLKSTG